MTPAVEHFIDEVASSWKFRWAGFAAASMIALAGWTVVFALPDRYQASARVFVDTRTALRPALKDLTIEQNVDAEINYVRESLLTGPLLEKMATDTGVLPANVSDPRERTRILDALTKRISLTVTSAGSQGDERSTAGTMYNIDYVDADRARGLRVVDSILTNFVERTLGGKREGSENAQRFLEAQIKDYEQRLSTAEERLAAFKKKNIGLMPSEQGGYFTQLQNEVDAEKKSETDLAIAISRRDELAKQLHGDAAISASGTSAPMVNGQVVGGGGDTLSRIQETQAKLDELLLKFTEKHPDVIATRAALEELKKRRAAELESLKRGDATAVAASGAGNNPVYQSIELEMNKEDVEIAALRRELSQHQGTVEDLRQRLNSAPEVEAEFQQLNRDYDVNKAEYAALLESYQKARIGERADTAGSVRFEVVLPPTSPVTPVWPRRTLFLLGALMLGIAGGSGVAYGLHAMRPVVRSATEISAFTKFPVLGVVSTAFPSRRSAQWRKTLWVFSAASFCLLVGFGIALALNWSGMRLSVQALTGMVKS